MRDSTFRDWMNTVKTKPLKEALLSWGPQAIGRYLIHTGDATDHSLPEPALLNQGIRVEREAGSHRIEPATRNWVLALRIGVVLAAIEQTQKHLSRRISEGKPTLQQKTVQSELGDALGLITEVLAVVELDSPLSSREPVDYERMSSAVTEAGRIVSRLMGGHGYVEGGIEFPLYFSHQLWSLTQSEVADA